MFELLVIAVIVAVVSMALLGFLFDRLREREDEVYEMQGNLRDLRNEVQMGYRRIRDLKAEAEALEHDAARWRARLASSRACKARKRENALYLRADEVGQ